MLKASLNCGALFVYDNNEAEGVSLPLLIYEYFIQNVMRYFELRGIDNIGSC